MHHISKSDYLKFRIHPAYLWYQKHARTKLPKPTENDEYVFEQGRDFEAIAQGIFENTHTIEAEAWQYDELLSKTNAVLDDKSVKTIFQASFMTQDRLFCRSDVIERVEDGWILSEIKSSTSVKASHIYDVAFQKKVMEQLGHNVVACRVVHVNKFYKKKAHLNPESLVAVRNITEQVDEVMPIVEKEITAAKAIIEQAEVDDHPALAGNLSEWLPVYRHLKGADIPGNSVLNFAQLTPQQLRSFYNSGIELINECEPSTLTEKQKVQQQAWQAEKPLIDQSKIIEFLNSLVYPLYFLDYETSAHVIPLYEGIKPYQQVPFQYSLHVLRAPEAELEHYEYLHIDSALPVEPLVAKLLDEIGATGTVLAWFDKFEKYCNRTMGDLAPRYHDELLEINKRMKDLRIPFANYGYVHKLFNGSTSIKNVLPVLVPELSYKELGIQEGGAAQRSWQQAVVGDRSAESKKIFKDLLEYCKLDTLAMVEILKVLMKVVEGDKIVTKKVLEQESMF